MLNNKSKSKHRKPRERQGLPAEICGIDQAENQQTQSNKAFKKLSMSFYNWATKNNDKQIVCEEFNTSFQEQGCKSAGSFSANCSRIKPPKLRKELRPESHEKAERVPRHRPMFQDYYFNKPTKSRLMGADQVFNMKKTPQYSEYMHYESTPMEITHFYYRHYNNFNSPQSHIGCKIRKPKSSAKNPPPRQASAPRARKQTQKRQGSSNKRAVYA